MSVFLGNTTPFRSKWVFSKVAQGRDGLLQRLERVPMAVNPLLNSILGEKWGVDVLSSDGGVVKLLVDPRRHSRHRSMLSSLA